MSRFPAAAVLASLLLASPALGQSQTISDVEKGLKGSGRYGQAGCGLGSMAFGAQPGGVQVLAATTNALFGTQTFGITTGTSNCGPGLLAEGTRNFVDANREVLAKDISRGQGESIGALTWINGCADSQAVGTALQARFGRIFPSESVSNEDVTNAILEALHADPALGCARG
ncbi:MAG TPA: DUF3015 family protein [Anaeromyxobacteraceae bacterium]|nr:DUF3015 family protein [Anaeromyxobacteraceae bacterium]